MRVTVFALRLNELLDGANHRNPSLTTIRIIHIFGFRLTIECAADPVAMPLPPDTHLGRYEIRSLLGAGGMGEVYLAEDTSLHRKVAVKLLPAKFTAEPARLHRFEREAFAASSLNHPNILTIYEIGAEDGSAGREQTRAGA